MYTYSLNVQPEKNSRTDIDTNAQRQHTNREINEQIKINQKKKKPLQIFRNNIAIWLQRDIF